MRDENINGMALDLSGALVLLLDERGRMLDANAAAWRVLGLDQADPTPPCAGALFGDAAQRLLSEAASAQGAPISRLEEVSGREGPLRTIAWTLQAVSTGAERKAPSWPWAAISPNMSSTKENCSKSDSIWSSAIKS